MLTYDSVNLPLRQAECKVSNTNLLFWANMAKSPKSLNILLYLNYIMKVTKGIVYKTKYAWYKQALSL